MSMRTARIAPAIEMPTSTLKQIDRLASIHERSREVEIVALLEEALAARGKSVARPRMPKERTPGEPGPKVDRLRRLVAAEDWRAAFKLAASLPRLGADKNAIQRAYEALERPGFMRQLRHDPDVLIAAGKEALRRRFNG